MAGTTAIVFQSASHNDEPVQARSGASSQPDQASDAEQAAADAPTRPSRLTPSASAEPKLLDGRTGGDTRTSRSEANALDTGNAAAPTARPMGAPMSPEQPAKAVPVTHSSPDKAPTADAPAPAPADQPGEQQPDDGGAQDGGLVSGVVDTVGATVDGVVGDLGIGTGLLGG
jgi:hypothetical protein